MTEYLHRVQYYETDAMGVVHHSNYIRWMEEAREVLLEEAGLPYAQLEQDGYISPVISVSCRYLSPAKFGEYVRIETALVWLDKVRFRYRYRMVDSVTGKVRVTGESEHCFISRAGKPISFWRENRAMYQRFTELVEEWPEK